MLSQKWHPRGRRRERRGFLWTPDHQPDQAGEGQFLPECESRALLLSSSSTASLHWRRRQTRKHSADELKVSREQSVTRHVSPLMIYSHWSAGWGSSAVTCKRSSSLIRHVQKRSHFRPPIAIRPAYTSSRRRPRQLVYFYNVLQCVLTFLEIQIPIIMCAHFFYLGTEESTEITGWSHLKSKPVLEAQLVYIASVNM